MAYLQHTDMVYVLRCQAYQEHHFHTILWSQLHGRISVFLPKKMAPRYLYLYQVTWRAAKKLQALEFNISHIHHMQGMSTLACYYVLEYMLMLSSDHEASLGLFDIITCTLTALERATHAAEVACALRIYERQSLAHLGYGLNIFNILDISHPYISYHPHQGYLGHSIPQAHPLCLPRTVLVAILTDHYHDPEVLRAAKKFFQTIVHILLPQHTWKCRSLFQAPTPLPADHSE